MNFLRAAALVLFVCFGAAAQALMPPAKLQFFDPSGIPLSGGYVYTCPAGTACAVTIVGQPPSNPLATYTDATLGTPNPNPIVLDSGGFAQPGIWVSSSTYKVVVTKADGTPIWTQDNVPGAGASGGSASTFTYSAPFSASITRTISSKLAEANINVTDAGAVCDGVTDDWAAFNRAAAWLSTGGSLYLPNRRCYLKSTWTISKPNLSVRGSGPASEVYYDGTGSNNDTQRAVYVLGAFSGLRALSNSGLAIGATSITATTSANTSDISAGDWLQIEEIDPTVADITYFDFAQVLSVSGTTINLMQPLRTNFPAFQTINFRHFTNPLGGIKLQDFKITAVGTLPGLIIAQGRGVQAEHLTIDAGKGITTYRMQDVAVRDLHVVRSSAQASEFGATVDLRVESNFFGGEGSSTNTGNVTLDLGTAFFDFSANQIGHPQNVGLQINFNVHDGTVTNNSMGFLTASAGQLGGGGIVARGAQRLVVTGNNFSGAASTLTSTAISFGDGAATNTITSTGNAIAFNSAQGYTQLHDSSYSPNDLYIDANAAGLTIARYLQSVASASSNYAQRFDLSGLNTGLSGTYTATNTYALTQSENTSYGGVRSYGYTSSSTSGEVAGVRLFGVSGQGTPSTAPMLETCGKISSNSVVKVATSDFCWGVENNPGSSNRLATLLGNGWLLLSNTGNAAETPAQMLEIRSATAPALRMTKYGANNYDIGYGLDGSNNLTFSFGGSVKAGIGFGGNFISGTGVGVSCSGTPSSSFASVGGIVTHC